MLTIGKHHEPRAFVRSLVDLFPLCVEHCVVGQIEPAAVEEGLSATICYRVPANKARSFLYKPIARKVTAGGRGIEADVIHRSESRAVAVEGDLSDRSIRYPEGRDGNLCSLGEALIISVYQRRGPIHDCGIIALSGTHVPTGDRAVLHGEVFGKRNIAAVIIPTIINIVETDCASALL